ncbi:hypothetical protein M0812_27159 [Anaeramoeba flamelloides]|uniref:Serpentine receptor class gamma n=1 Tax=Anaeramoeba flamelloides TaxID=1746091 RepID=A0AAV7Y9B6_9EUKA|nr:hypothetical protein M0812_27159 [Anaeramoeba flamelloides]
MEEKSQKYTVLIILDCLLLLPCVLSTKRIITQNKKGFEKSYHNFFYFCVFVSTWGLFFTVLVYLSDLKLMEKVSIEIFFQLFVVVLLYGVYTLVVIQANLYFNCKYKDEKIAKAKTKKIFYIVTFFVILVLAFQVPNFFVSKRKTFATLKVVQYSILVLPMVIDFYYYFKIRSAIKDVSDMLMMKQMRKLFWVILVCTLILITTLVLLLITQFYPKKLNSLWTLIFYISSASFTALPPFIIMLVIFRPAKFQSDPLLLSENSSDSDISLV